MFKAALQRNKQFLKGIMDFQETEENSVIQNNAAETPDASKKGNLKSTIQNKTAGTPDISERRNLKFNVNISIRIIIYKTLLKDLF